MVQEIQQTLNGYTEPNRIEGIGISERKIKEHYQVTPKMGYGCKVSAKRYPSAWYQDRDYPSTQGTFTFDSQSGQTLFTLISGGLRIPTAGGYLAKISLGGGSSNFSVTIKLKTATDTLYSETFSNGTNSVEMVLNLGKFDVVEARCSGYYSGSGSASTDANITLSLQKL